MEQRTGAYAADVRPQSAVLWLQIRCSAEPSEGILRRRHEARAVAKRSPLCTTWSAPQSRGLACDHNEKQYVKPTVSFVYTIYEACSRETTSVYGQRLCGGAEHGKAKGASVNITRRCTQQRTNCSSSINSLSSRKRCVSTPRIVNRMRWGSSDLRFPASDSATDSILAGYLSPNHIHHGNACFSMFHSRLFKAACELVAQSSDRAESLFLLFGPLARLGLGT